jgi:tetratricopeptide (TPR) repeat protein
MIRTAWLLALLAPVAVGLAAQQADTTLAARADAAFRAQDWRPAAHWYGEIVDRDSSDSRAWYRYGVALQQSGDTTGALRAYRRTLALAAAPAAMYNLASLYAGRAMADSAFAWLDRAAAAGLRQYDALQRDPDFVPLHADPRFAALVARLRTNALPCAARPHSADLDFWVGEWDVHAPDGRPAGRSRITRVLGGCAVLETWAGVQGDSGQSLNAIDPATGVWQQTWVDDQGHLREFLDGHREDSTMVYPRSRPDRAGRIDRMRLERLSATRVRQTAEESTDGGATWRLRYTLVYERRR